MNRVAFVAASVVFAVAMGVGGVDSVAAHDGASAYVLVTSDFVLPGQPFQVVVADIGEDAPVDFTITHEARTEALGSSRAAPDGHLMTDLVVPAGFPEGYAQLFATVPDVVWTSTWVWVGQRTWETPPPPSAASAAPWWSDPSVIVLAVLALGAVGVVGYLVLRPRRVAPQRAPSPAARPRRSSGKRSGR
jgi:hypothetical protein